MPIYAYKCSECGHEVELLQKLSDPAPTECPNCHRAALVKQVTAAGFQLKGSGWYATDFRNSGAPKKDAKVEAGAPTESSEKSDPGAKSETDAKTETTAAPATPKESAAPKESASRKDSTASPPPPPASGAA